MSCAKATQSNSRSIWSIAEASNLSKILTINIALVCSTNVWRETIWTQKYSTILGSKIDWVKTEKHSKTVCLMSSERSQRFSMPLSRTLSCQEKVGSLTTREWVMEVVLAAEQPIMLLWWECNKLQRPNNIRTRLNNHCKMHKPREEQLTLSNSSMTNVVQISRRRHNKCSPRNDMQHIHKISVNTWYILHWMTPLNFTLKNNLSLLFTLLFLIVINL